MQRRGEAPPGRIYGRDDEISGIRELLRNTGETGGSVLFLKGEAGVGKTTLLRIAEELARGSGFQIMRGWCLPESLEPLLPIRDALISGGLEQLYTGEGDPRIEGIYLINSGGVPMAKAEREEFAIDSDIFASMISAVGDFLRESMAMMNLSHGAEDARSLSYGDYRIVIESGERMNIAALIKGKENEFLLADLSRLLRAAEKENPGGEWGGDRGEMRKTEEMLGEFLETGPYDGTSYDLDDPRLRRSHLFENILMGLQRYSMRKPVLMVLDDLQWADPSTLSLIHYLARNIGGMQVSIIGAYRPEDTKERKHPLVETIRLMNREGLLKEMKVRRLGIGDTMMLISERLPGMQEEELQKLVNAVYSTTEGNPFFVLETLSVMKEGGSLQESDGKWIFKGGEVDIPPRVYDIMIRKLDRLEPEERDILEKGSIFGLEFGLQNLACLCGEEITGMAGEIRDIERNHGVLTRKGDYYRFQHSMMRQIVYNEIPPVIRKTYHLKAAECMTETGSDGEIGMQFYLAGSPKGVDYLIRAAEEAKKTYSNLEAIREYGMAYEICTSEEKKTGIMESVGHLYSLTGSYERALQIYREVFGKKEKTDVAGAVSVITKISAILDKLGRYDSAMEWIDRGEKLLQSTGEKHTREEGNLLLARGNILMRTGEMKEAEKLFERAREILKENGHQADMPGAYLAQGLVMKAMGGYDRALEYMEKSAELSEKNGDFVTVARTYNSIGSIYGETGDEEKALEYYRKALGMSEKIGDLWNISGSYNNIGTTFAMLGKPERAVLYYEKALKIAKKIGELRGAALLYNNLGGLQYDMGHFDKAMENYREALKIARSIGAKWEEILSMNNLAEAYRTTGRMREAERLHESGLAESRDMGERMLEIFHRCGLAEIHIETGFRDKNDELMKMGIDEAMQTAKAAEEIEIRDAVALSHRIAGEAYLLNGDAKKAEEHLLKALKIYRQMERKTDMTISIYLLSMLHDDREGEEMRKEAEELIGSDNWKRWKDILKKRWNHGGSVG